MAIYFYPTKYPREKALFVLTDKVYDELEPVFAEFRKKTGIFIDPYGDTKLVAENLMLINQLIKGSYTSKELSRLADVQGFLFFIENEEHREVMYAVGD